MDLLLNDLSLHGQFPDIITFREAIYRVMSMRKLANSYDREVYSHRNILYGLAYPTASLHEALQSLPRDEKQAILRWLTRHGPFWDEVAQHSPDLWMTSGDEIVTDTAVGEAAHCISVDISRGLVSLVPSKWQLSPIRVKIVSDTETDVCVPNYWELPDLEAALQEAKPPISTWDQLESESRAKFQRLFFSSDCYNHLEGQPFAPGAAARILSLLGVLDQLTGSVDASRRRTSEGHRLYQDHFTGKKAWFSDSSDTEKRKFGKELTFPDPLGSGRPLFCTWHGKVKTPPLRIHFAWPNRSGGPFCIVYIGMKITRQ